MTLQKTSLLEVMALLAELRREKIILRRESAGISTHPPLSELPESIWRRLLHHEADILELMAGGISRPSFPKLETLAPFDTNHVKHLWNAGVLHKYFGSDLTNIVQEMRYIDHPIEISALNDAIIGLANRHDILRSAFFEDEGLCLRYASDSEIAVRPVDCRAMQISEIDSAVMSLASNPFQNNDCVLKTYLLSIKENSHILLMIIHHSVVDVASRAIISADIDRIYSLIISDKRSLNLIRPIQYSEYVNGMKSWLDHHGQSALTYWRKALSGSTSTVIPEDDAPANLSETGGGRKSFWFGRTLQNKIGAYSQSVQAPEHVIILAAKFLTLYKYSKSEDLIVNVQSSLRTEASMESLVGMLVAEVPYRLAISPSETLEQIVLKVLQLSLKVRENQLPSHIYREILQENNERVRAPWFNFISTRSGNGTVAGTPPSATLGQHMPRPELPAQTNPDHRCPYSFMIQMHQSEKLLGGTLVYSKSLYRDQTIQSFIDDWMALTEKIADDPALTVSEAVL